jgi:hypothetical protein
LDLPEATEAALTVSVPRPVPSARVSPAPLTSGKAALTVARPHIPLFWMPTEDAAASKVQVPAPSSAVLFSAMRGSLRDCAR